MKNKEKKIEVAEKKNNVGVNTDISATEVLNWLTKNVESFIDNKTRVFDIELIIDDSAKSQFLETSKVIDAFVALDKEEDTLVSSNEILKDKLQKLAKAYSEKDIKKLIKDFPQYDKILKAKAVLHSIVFDIFKSLKSNEKSIKELRENLFQRMAYFYEVRGIHKGNLVVDNFDGKIAITDFVYSGFEVEVKTTKKDKEGNQLESKSYVIPPRLSIKLEIILKSKSTAQSLF